MIVQFVASGDPHDPAARRLRGHWDAYGWGEGILITDGKFYDPVSNFQDRTLGYMNTGFGRGELRAICQAKAASFYYFPLPGAGRNPSDGYQSDFVRFDSALDTPVVTLAQTFDAAYSDAANPDGAYFLEVWSGGNGTNESGTKIYTIPVPIPRAWIHIEFLADGSVYINEALAYAGSVVGTPDRFVVRWERFGFDGFSIDNILVRNSTIPFGKAQIYTCFPRYDVGPNEMSVNGKTYTPYPPDPTQHAAYVRESAGLGGVINGYPDGDTSYLLGGSGESEFYTITTPQAYGDIAAVQIRATARPDDSSTPENCSLIPYGMIGGVKYQPNLCTSLPAELTWSAGDTAYAHVIGIWENNPDTGLAWTYGDVLGLRAGCQSMGENVRVTQIAVEVVMAVTGGSVGAYYAAY